MPDYYRGLFCDVTKVAPSVSMDFLAARSDWATLKKDFETFVLPYALKQGAKSIGTFGFCWGCYAVVRISSNPVIKCGVSFHPSHPPIMEKIGENEEEIMKAIKCPQLMMPAGHDHKNVKIGGLDQRVLGKDCEIVEFPDMVHGWSVRGDCTQPDVDRDVKKAFEEAICFLKKHL